MKFAPIAAAMLSSLAVFAAGTANAAEVKVLASTAIKTALEVLAPQFEKATEHKVSVTYGASARLQPEIEKGAAFDLAILSVAVADALIKQGKLVAATRVDIARSGAGVAVRKGAPRPDISSTASFKRALLDANSLGYSETGGDRAVSHGHVPAPRHHGWGEAQAQACAAQSAEPAGAGRRRNRPRPAADQ